LRHGLNAAAPDGGDRSDEVLELARRLGGRAEPSAAGLRAAEAELHLVRIRTIKHRVLESALAHLEAEVAPEKPLTPGETLARALAASASELARLDGYERKARSRRKRAFRALGVSVLAERSQR
jgi:hypothetical protein